MDIARGMDLLANRINAPCLFETTEYRVARTKEELEKAYALVYQEYLKRNYISEKKSGLRISLHNALPETTTFVGIIEDEMVATATVIPDSPLGLPMDAIYHKELEHFRLHNKKICEISMLASNTDLFGKSTSLMLNAEKMFFVFSLFKCIFDYTRNLGFDYICITIHPKHKLTYDFLLFKDCGELKTYKSVNEAPAIAKYLDIHSAKKECITTNKEGLYRIFFSNEIPSEKFSQKKVLTPDDLKYFFAEKTELFKTARPQDLKHIKECYPEYDFSQII